MTDLQQQIRETELRLRDLRRQAENERKERAQLVQPSYAFTLIPVELNQWDRIYDPSCTLYILQGSLLNGSELVEVGKHASSGQMTYLYNGATKKFAVAVGGGTIFVKDRQAWNELSEVVAERPDMELDVTDIVNRGRAREGRDA